MDIQMQPVTSSQINALGFDADSGTLAIQFKNGRGDVGSLYHYSNVTPDLFEALRGAESIGSYFGKHIKPFADKFPYEKQGGGVLVEKKAKAPVLAKAKAADIGTSVAVVAAPAMPAMVEFRPEEFLPAIQREDNLVAQAGRAVCESQADFAKGGDLVKLLRSLRAEFEDGRDQRVRPHNAYVKELNAWFKQHTAVLDEADAAVIQKMNVWRRKENERLESERREAQRKRDDEALKEAAKLEKKGKTEEAAKVLEKAIETPAQVVEVSKVRGSFGSVAGSKKVWKVKVLNIRALNDACVNAIMTNDRAVDAIRVALKPLTDAMIAARDEGATAVEIPGLSVKQEDETNVR
jgi:hypothetical protein